MDNNSNNNNVNEIIQRLVKIEVKLDDLNTFKNNIERQNIEIVQLKDISLQQQKEIDELKSTNTYLNRLMISTIVSGLVAFITMGLKVFK